MRRLSFEAKDLECIAGAMSLKAVQRSLYAHGAHDVGIMTCQLKETFLNSSKAPTMPTFLDLCGLLRRSRHSLNFAGALRFLLAMHYSWMPAGRPHFKA